MVNSNKGQKKKKVRKITFLRGKNDQSLDNVKPIDCKEIVNFFSELIKQHPNYVFSRPSINTGKKKKAKQSDKQDVDIVSKEENEINYEDQIESSKGKEDNNDNLKVIAKKDDKDDKQDNEEMAIAEEPKKNPLKDELIFGLSEIMRKIQRNQAIGVIVTDPLTIHVQSTIFDLCKEFNVDFLLVQKLEDLVDILGLSKLSCMAFTSKVKDPSAICSQLYQIFTKNAKKFDPQQVDYNPSIPYPLIASHQTLKYFSWDHQTVGQSDHEELVKTVLNFNFPDLTTEEEMDTAPSIEPSDVKLNKSSLSEGFISLKDDSKNNYFPNRWFFQELNLQLPWSATENVIKKPPINNDLGKTLFVSEKVDKKLRKELESKTTFMEPKTIQLPSSGKPKKKIRMKFKKLNQRKK